MPTKRVRIGKMPPSEKAVTVEPVKDEEASQLSEGKLRLMEWGRVTRPEVWQLKFQRSAKKSTEKWE